MLLSFLGAALAIMKYNAYPSQVFVGDTFCYFAGIVLALSAIFGNSYTLHRLNFVSLSFPVHPPAHKLPLLSASALRVLSLPPS